MSTTHNASADHATRLDVECYAVKVRGERLASGEDSPVWLSYSYKRAQAFRRELAMHIKGRLAVVKVRLTVEVKQ